MEDETASFSEYFDSQSRRGAGGGPPAGVQEVVLPLHDEALHQLSEIARKAGVAGSNEHMRSIALQISLDRFVGACRDRGGESLLPELHLSSGPLKDRTLCLFSDTMQELARLERELHCSETILLETAIQQAAHSVASRSVRNEAVALA